MSSKSATVRWAADRERELVKNGKPKRAVEEAVSVSTLREFASRFMDGYARANRQKPSGIAAKETILRTHLIPTLGDRRLDAITTEDVQGLKTALGRKSPKTVNNVLTVLNVLLKTAVEWAVIERLPCVIRLVRTSVPTASFHESGDYARLVEFAALDGRLAHLVVLLGGDAGLRCGEMMALEWGDINLAQRQLVVARSEWKGQVTTPKSGRLRRLPLTRRLADALSGSRHLKGSRVLVNAEGQPLTQKMVQGIVSRVARRAKVKEGVHTLRHTFCSELAARGVPARSIQALAGHEDLGTTQRYMHISPVAVDEAIRLLELPAVGVSRGGMLEAAGNRP